tara:strand:+ start:1133 stop:2314 length:1182 start_codon:yes stop_codon:yes gene_type:complete
MFFKFFSDLRRLDVPVSLREYLDLLAALDKGLGHYQVEEFYYLARTILIKNESHIDRFDQVFASIFRGLEAVDFEEEIVEIPEEWLRKMGELLLTEEEKENIESLGGWEKLMETLRQRLEEQKERHQGGNKWIGTQGKSPFGAHGYNPEGIRIGQEENRNYSAVKVWDKRIFRDLDSDIELGTRNIKVALRRLRKFAREGSADELDLDDTVSSTARNGGWLDIKMVPERHNAVKVLLLFDVGGSMDSHVRTCEELFSAARTEFKHLEYYYFHNCIYESVWKENRRRQSRRLATWDLLHTYPSDYKLIIVGDAAMSPYEIAHPGGSVEHWNEESGDIWLRRLVKTYPNVSWLNPLPKDRWRYFQSAGMVSELLEGRMFPLTLDGLESAMRSMNN